MVQSLIRLILLFFVYSFAGWCMEVILKWIQYHRFINRGFFTGPICPIYGSGAVLITVAVGALSRFESAYGTTFAVSFLLCGAVEYLTSYFMERKYHARWWDYSQKPMNLHGRIWIGNLILFGLAGVAIIHLLNPLLDAVLATIPIKTRYILVAVLLAIFAADYVMTHFILKLVKVGVESSQADSTEEINKEIRVLLSDRSIFYRRFADAYPEVIYRTERITARLDKIRSETERIRREAERHLGESAQQVVDRLEPSTMIKSGIIQKQDALIRMLYSEEQATPEIQELLSRIDQEKERLQSRPLTQITGGRKSAE